MAELAARAYSAARAPATGRLLGPAGHPQPEEDQHGRDQALIERGGLDILDGEVIGLCAESHCRFLGPLSYPGNVEACMRVGHLGSSSVRYELALFGDDGQCSAVGWFVHVFVDRKTRRPAQVTGPMRELLEGLEVDR